MLIDPGAVRNQAGSANIFQDIYFESSPIHQPKIIYRFEHTNHDILLFFFFFKKSLQTLFACV